MPLQSSDKHRIGRSGWLRAAVLGADDGILSTASLVLGVASAQATHTAILVAGSMSMAAGEYVSVHSQADTEKAELNRERQHLRNDDDGEHRELAAIYAKRGLDPNLASQVAAQLMSHNALDAHARDELGITETLKARPLQAALASGLSFFAGAALPLLVVALAPTEMLIVLVAATSLILLTLLGGLAAYAGGANIVRGAWRISFWGMLAMGVTAGVGKIVGSVFGVGG